jgi:hypothetical protein
MKSASQTSWLQIIDSGQLAYRKKDRLPFAEEETTRKS